MRPRAAREFGAWALVRWQRSLQLRVAATTLVVTGVGRAHHRVLHRRPGHRRRAQRQARRRDPARPRSACTDAKSAFTSIDVDRTPATSRTATSLLLASPERRRQRRRAVQHRRRVPTTDSRADGTAQGIPAALRTRRRSAEPAVQYAPVAGAPHDRRPLPGLIVGAPVQAAQRPVRAVLPVPAHRRAADDLAAPAHGAAGGLGLVLLVVAIAMLVTRQVVRPVRVAAQTAGRLAAGDLSQRISVRGSDDIARLGRSFNDMAGSLQRQIRRLEDLSRLQRRFTSDVSHELRTPLTTIRMASELLHSAREEFPPELSRIGRAAARPNSTGSRRCSATCSRSPATTPASPASRPRRPTSAAWSPRPSRPAACWPSGTAASSSCDLPAAAGHRRHGLAAGSSASCATCSATPSTTARAARSWSRSAPTRTRSRSPCATTASGCAPARPAWSSTGSGAATRRAAG